MMKNPRWKMRSDPIYCAVAACFLMSACASTPVDPAPPGPGPEQLALNEHAFAAAVAEHGVREGFLDFLSEEARVFVPQAVNAHEHYLAQPPSPALLAWQPVYAELAASRDFGYTTGPWELRATKETVDPAVSGHYVSIWKVMEEGGWKCVLDLGIAHGPHPAPAADTELRSNVAGHSPETLEATRAELLEQEEALTADAAERGVLAAYRDRIAPAARIYRMGEFPGQGEAAFAERLGPGDASWTWFPTFAETSTDGHLGYVYGEGTPDDPEIRFSYARIWRRELDGTWRIVLDVHLPLPPGTYQE